MKKNTLTKFFKGGRIAALTLAAILTGSSLYGGKVFAGSSDIVIDNSSFAESLNSSVWNDPNGELTVSGGKIIFNSEQSADSRLITKSAIMKSSQHSELFDVEYSMKIRKIPEGKTFAVAFSLANIESILGEEESLVLAFENQSGALKAVVYSYDADGKAVALTTPKSVGGSFGSTFHVKANATKDSKLKIVVNGTTLYNDTTSVDLTGRVGFLQNAASDVEISKVNIVSHKYDTPENPNVTEDFENSTINVNAFDSYMNRACNYFPSGLTIEELNGENVLLFNNVGMGWFGTTYQYSNFECTFDVPYILFKNVLREDGSIKQPANSGFVFSYGDLADYYDESGYSNSADAIVFTSTEVRNHKDATKKTAIETLGLYDRDNNIGYSVKIRVEDTQFTLHMKALGSSNWQEILSYKIGNETPMGYIHIWSSGSANMAIDNFSVKNLDKDAKTIEVDYKGSAIEGAKDWEYEPMKVVYLDDVAETQEDKVFGIISWPMVLAIASGLGIVIIAICLTVAKVRKTSKTTISEKEAEKNEV